MAVTKSGTEFYLVEVTPRTEEVERVLVGAVRPGDAVFWADGSLYVAVVADVRGGAQAVRRLMRIAKDEHGVATHVRMVPEPFPEAVDSIARRVISGEIRVAPRRDASSIPWEG